MTEQINEWVHATLVDFIGNQLFRIVGGAADGVEWAAGYALQAPHEWNPEIFTTIYTIGTTILRGVAGSILALILIIDFIQMITAKNDGIEFDVAIYLKWIVKAFVGLFIINNTYGIVLAGFDLSSQAMGDLANLVSGSYDDLSTMINPYELIAVFEEQSIGQLLSLLIQLLIISMIMPILNVVIRIAVYGRLFETLIAMSLAPIPLITLVSAEHRAMGMNYIKVILAYAFQGFLMMVALAIYSSLIGNIITGIFAADGDPATNLWGIVMLSVLLGFALFKVGSISKSVFGAS